jgi:hypothetical protein
VRGTHECENVWDTLPNGTCSPREGEVRVEGGPHIQLKSRREGDVRIVRLR